MEILYTVAHDRFGEIVTASEAVKGNEFNCPLCLGVMILRKSGKTGKGRKRPHFAHKSLTPNCTPESVLHYGFKMLLAKKLITLISERTPLIFDWNCAECDEIHKGDLLKKIQKAEVEYYLDIARPDIALLNESVKPHAVIEVVVTHAPEPSVIQFYKDNDIIFIRINIDSETDIENIDNKIAHPDLVDICLHPTCPKCGHHLHKARLYIVECKCWSCGDPMKMAYVKAGHFRIQVPGFKPEWFKTASDNGVVIKDQYSGTRRERYLANTCKGCNAFIGDHYLFTDYCWPAELGELKSTSFDIGYECNYCEEANMSDYSKDD